ncbi:MAG: hypothetical protein AAFX93_10350 [Verrucomicrobiota bacterium]
MSPAHVGAVVNGDFSNGQEFHNDWNLRTSGLDIGWTGYGNIGYTLNVSQTTDSSVTQDRYGSFLYESTSGNPGGFLLVDCGSHTASATLFNLTTGGAVYNTLSLDVAVLTTYDYDGGNTVTVQAPGVAATTNTDAVTYVVYGFTGDVVALENALIADDVSIQSNKLFRPQASSGFTQLATGSITTGGLSALDQWENVQIPLSNTGNYDFYLVGFYADHIGNPAAGVALDNVRLDDGLDVLVGTPDAHVEGAFRIEAYVGPNATSDGNEDGLTIQYSDYQSDPVSAGSVQFSVNEPLAEWLWQQNSDLSAETQMSLSGANALTLYDATGSPAIVFDPVTKDIAVDGASVFLNGSGVLTADVVETENIIEFIDTADTSLFQIVHSNQRLLQFAGTNLFMGRFLSDPVITTGYNNIAFGVEAGRDVTSGRNNIAFGSEALFRNESGDANIAIGQSALKDATTAIGNIGIGSRALQENLANYNLAVGYYAMADSFYAESNIAIGRFAMRDAGTLDSPNDVRYNVVLGEWGLRKLADGLNNVAVARYSGDALLTGDRNTFLGSSAGTSITDGSDNTFVGSTAGKNQLTGSNNIAIGKDTILADPNSSNQLNIGNTIYGDLSNDLIGIGISVPLQALHVDGHAQVDGSLILNDATGLASAGAIRWTGTDFEGYDGSTWISLTSGVGGSGGSSWFNGAGAPDGATGDNGDYYLNTVTGDVYEKLSGTWGVIANLTGPEATSVTGLSAGTVSAPTFSFDSDSDTGIFSPAADTLAFATAGAERLSVDTNGFVGVGTGATPLTERLVIDGAVVVGDTTTMTPGAIRYNATDNTFEGYVDTIGWKRFDLDPADLLATDTLTLSGNILSINYADSTSDQVDLSTIAGSGSGSGSALTDPTDPAVNVVEVVDSSTVAFNANLGIGVAAPTEKLEVGGAIVIGDLASTPKQGAIRYNSTDDAFEGYVADADGLGNPGWVSLTAGGDTTNGEIAFGWGDHAAESYLKAIDLSLDTAAGQSVVIADSNGSVTISSGTDPADPDGLTVAGHVQIDGDLQVNGLVRRGDVYMGQFGRVGDQYEGQ